MKVYRDLLLDVMTNGNDKGDRTGTGTRSVFGRQLRFDLKEGFPLLTTKRLNTRAIWHELLWMIRGDTNVSSLNEVGVHIWDEWADANGELGPVYGAQWRGTGGGPDQLMDAVELIQRDPDSRRIVVDSWQTSHLSDMALAPCHCLFQFYVANGELSCQLYQRSADIFIGVPFNIASYAMLTHMVAKVSGLKPGEFTHTFGDLHLYSNHVIPAYQQLKREPWDLPTCRLDNTGVSTLTDFKFAHLEQSIKHYYSHPSIKAEISV